MKSSFQHIQMILMIVMMVVFLPGANAMPAAGSDMSYATLQDLAEREQLNDLAEAAGKDYPDVTGEELAIWLADGDMSDWTEQLPEQVGVVVKRLEKVLQDSSAEADGYLAGQYTVPLERVPDVVRVKVTDIAVSRLFGGEQDSERAVRYRDAIRFFEKVAGRIIDLDIVAAEDSSDSSARFSGATPGLKRENLKGFI